MLYFKQTKRNWQSKAWVWKKSKARKIKPRNEEIKWISDNTKPLWHPITIEILNSKMSKVLKK